MKRRARIVLILLDPIDVVCVFMELVEAQFILHPEENEKRASQSEGEAKNVDERIPFVLEQIAKGDFEDVSQHGSGSCGLEPEGIRGQNGKLLRKQHPIPNFKYQIPNLMNWQERKIIPESRTLPHGVDGGNENGNQLRGLFDEEINLNVASLACAVDCP